MFVSISSISQAAPKKGESFKITECRPITLAGSYVLENDLLADGTCLTIEADFVTIDLGEHSITGQGLGNGITDLGIARTGTTVMNGTVAGFENGIVFDTSKATTITNVLTLDNTNDGLLLGVMSTVRNNKAIQNDRGIVVECPSNLIGNAAWDNVSEDLNYIYPNLCDADLQHNSFGQSAAVICPTSLTNCGGIWVCLDNNHDYCGSCGNVCGDGASCNNGECEENPFCSIFGVCDDYNICTIDTCDSNQCSNTPTPGYACSDNNKCTVNDTCGVDGSCTGQAMDCTDSLACTVDSCDGSGGCDNAVLAGYCVIDDVCWGAGVINPVNENESCQPDINQYDWTPVP